MDLVVSSHISHQQILVFSKLFDYYPTFRNRFAENGNEQKNKQRLSKSPHRTNRQTKWHKCNPIITCISSTQCLIIIIGSCYMSHIHFLEPNWSSIYHNQTTSPFFNKLKLKVKTNQHLLLIYEKYIKKN